VEDAEDVVWLKRARKKPLHYRPLEVREVLDADKSSRLYSIEQVNTLNRQQFSFWLACSPGFSRPARENRLKPGLQTDREPRLPSK
jgi:hypothetical protein